MHELAITFVVTYHDPNKMNQPDQVRHFPTEHDARVFASDTLEKIAPKAKNVHIMKITTKKERIY